MSTKALGQMLDDVSQQALPRWDEIDAAKAELAALRKAAKEACRGSVTHRLMSSDEGVELELLLESIAKEAP